MLLRNLALASSLALATAPAVAYAKPEAPVAAQTVKVQVPQSSPSDAKGYAEREQQDKKTGEFQGGDLIVIGVSGGALLVLLLVLLIIL